MRAVDEWIGKDDNAAIPPRVKDRIAQKSDDYCQQCARKIGGRLRGEFDHVIPLCLGGQHRESNLALVCNECHLGKTRLDVKLKAKVARVRKRHLGIKKPSRFACSRTSKFKKRLDGTVVLRANG
jgi:5-methylcytosine-specific restriction endonuclease McrA